MAFAQQNLRSNKNLLSALADVAQQVHASHATGQAATTSFVALTVNSTAISLTLPRAGTWDIQGEVAFAYAGATFAAVQTVSVELYDSTAAAVIDTFTADAEIVTTYTGNAMRIRIARRFVTAVLNNVYTLRIKVATAPGAGALNANKANFTANFIG